MLKAIFNNYFAVCQCFEFFSILKCQSNVSKQIVGNIAVYGSSLSVTGFCE